MTTRYVMTSQVLEVDERRRTVSTRKDKETGEEIVETVSLGWFIKLEGNFALGIGPDKPELEKGDYVKHTLEKIAPPAPVDAGGKNPV